MAQTIREAVDAAGGSFYQWLSETDIGSLSGDLQSLKSELASVVQQLNTLGLSFQALETSLNTQIALINTQVSEMQTTVESFQEEVAVLSANLNTIQATISSMQTTLTSLSSSLSALQTTVNGLNATVTRHETSILNLVNSIVTLNNTINGIQNSVNSLQTTMDTTVKNGDSLTLSLDSNLLRVDSNGSDKLVTESSNSVQSSHTFSNTSVVAAMLWSGSSINDNAAEVFSVYPGYSGSAVIPTLTPSTSVGQTTSLGATVAIVAQQQMLPQNNTIRVENRPNQTAPPPGVFMKSGDIPDDLEDGAMVSELGPAAMLPTWFGEVAGFELRKSRITRKNRPFNPYGRMYLGNALSSPIVTQISIPAVGSTIMFTSELPGLLRFPLVNMLMNYRMDVTYILHVPTPLGYSQQLRIYAPEIDNSTTTRGVIWKPGACPTLAVGLGWRLPNVIQQGTTTQPAGSPGLSLSIECIEDNSAADMSQPAQMIIWTYYHNVEVYNWRRVANNTLTSVAFQPVASTLSETMSLDFATPIDAEEQMDPGAIGDVPEVGASLTGEKTEESAPAEATKAAAAPSTEAASTAGSSKQAKTPQQKWHKFSVVNFALADGVGTVNTLTLRPYTLAGRGDGLFRPFGRNVFCAPSRMEGRLAGLEWRLVSNRAPSFAALIEARTNTQTFYNDCVYHTVGGEPTTLFSMNENLSFSSSTGTTYRRAISPWVSCSSYTESITLTMIGRNYVQDRANFSVTVYVRPGKMRFNVPIKPRARAQTFVRSNAGELRAIIDRLSTLGVIEAVEQMNPAAWDHQVWSAIEDHEVASNDHVMEGLRKAFPSGGNYSEVSSWIAENGALAGQSHIAPEANHSGYGGLADTVAEQGEDIAELEQGQFWIKAGDITLYPNTVVPINLNLPEMVDENGNGGETPITEFFNRYADIAPRRTGQFGPVVGTYFLKCRPPNNITLDVEHICVPPELNVEAALRFFGLESLLGMAGSAISSLGGGLVDGAISTISGLLGNLLGGGNSTAEGVPSKIQDPNSSGGPSATGGIFGEIPVTRFLEFFKTITGTQGGESIWPTLLTKVVSTLASGALSTYALDSIPATLYVRLDSATGMRNVYDRANYLEPSQTLSNAIYLDQAQLGTFMSHLLDYSDDRAKTLLLKSFKLMRTRLESNSVSQLVDITKLDLYDEATTEDMYYINTYLMTHS